MTRDLCEHSMFSFGTSSIVLFSADSLTNSERSGGYDQDAVDVLHQLQFMGTPDLKIDDDATDDKNRCGSYSAHLGTTAGDWRELRGPYVEDRV